jgi:glutaredoxin
MMPKHIVMYTRPGCEDSDAAREFLRKRHFAFHEVNIDENPAGLRFVMSVNEGKERTPTFEVDCRVFHCSPFDPHKLARELGLQREETIGESEPQSAVRRPDSCGIHSPEGY